MGHHHGHHHHGGEQTHSSDYKKAGWIGIAGALVEGGVGFFAAASYGATSDAIHALSDAISFFVSARIADQKGKGRWTHEEIERFGIEFNTAFLIFAIALIGYGLYVGHPLGELSSPFMFLAGIAGLGFNYWQLRTLGEIGKEGISLHKSVWQHALYDLLYSVAVIVASCISFFIESEVDAVWKVLEAAGIVVIFALLAQTTKIIDLEKMSSGDVSQYIGGVAVAVVLSAVLVIVGDPLLIDRIVGGLLCLGMGKSVWENNRDLKESSKHDHHHGHSH